MLMISPQVREDISPIISGTYLPDWSIIVPPLAAESWPLHPLWPNQALFEWWLTRPNVMIIRTAIPQGSVNLSALYCENLESQNDPQSQLTPELKQVVELIGEREIGDEIDATTDHAWLIVLGHFAQALDLVAKLEEVSLSQRQGQNGKPQSKIIEFLVGILGGIDYLRDLNCTPNPIATDSTVAEAWAQEIFSHYSQVSRTLDAADEQTYADVLDVLRTISAPYIQQAVTETLIKEEQLTIDLDLTGRTVSPNSQDYPDADFGYMAGKISKGYQAAITSLVTQRWGRLMLTLQRYNGRTLSADCLQAAIYEVEQLLQVRPRRRSQLVQQRRRAKLSQIDQRQEELAARRRRMSTLWQDLELIQEQIKEAGQTVANLEAEYSRKMLAEKPHSKLAKARRKVASLGKRKLRLEKKWLKEQRAISKIEREIRSSEEELMLVDEWLAELEADNSANPNPVKIVLRIDAGFSTGSNLTWLIEMGYTVLTKAYHGKTAHKLQGTLSDEVCWTKVGKNTEAVLISDYYQNSCPYPLETMLLRYHLADKTCYTTLLYYDECPPPAAREWFKWYNGRQTIEAGIKEGKGVFTLKRHLVRSPIGMLLQEQFAIFSANFTRWAAAWASDLVQQANPKFIKTLGEVKNLVRVLSHTRARWVRNQMGNSLIFDEVGPFTGTILCLSGQVAIQLALPLFNFM